MKDQAPGMLVVRADASLGSGSGHVMRCLAIAQAWQDIGGDAVFALRETALYEPRLRSEGIRAAVIDAAPGSAEDAAQLIELAHTKGAAWVVVDGYCFDAAYQLALKQAGFKLVFVDDYGHAERYYADIILNPNPQGKSIAYNRREAHTRLLAGPEFALIRREFRRVRASQTQVPLLAKRLLVTMGGSDENNFTEVVLKALPFLHTPGLEATVVVGGANPHKGSLREVAASLGSMVKLVENTSAMPALMKDADLAVTAGGATCYELAFLGVPMIAITLAQNQEPTCRELADRGVAIDAGWFYSLEAESLCKRMLEIMGDPDGRKSLGDAGRSLVDGEGARHVVAYMRENKE
jgi:UDP-2,4-diacetamido-2,4,6-trideoxy-beta-L-altropyranose hydrolase